MKEYHKIETLWKFDPITKKHVPGAFYNRLVGLLKDNQWRFTEKIDGTNFRIYWDGHKLSYAGRTLSATFSKEQIAYIEKKLVNQNMETVFEQTFMEKSVVIYGELYGEKIQSGGDYVRLNGTPLSDDEIDFQVFDIMIEDVFLTYNSTEELSEQLGFKCVPIVLLGTIDDALEYLGEKHKNRTLKSLFSDAPLEGLIGVPTGDFYDRFGKRIIIKLKVRDLF